MKIPAAAASRSAGRDRDPPAGAGPRVLVVDDDRRLLELIQRYLGARGLCCSSADNGCDALLLAREVQPDLVLIDAEMPDLDGNAVCRVLKGEPATRHIPVILMSGSRVGERDLLAGFSGGADEYLLKPFSLAVLLARLQALLRRCRAPAAPERLRRAGLELDLDGRTVRNRGKGVPVTRKEFDLLAVLMAKAGRALSIPYLLERVWGHDPADFNDPGTVEVHVCRIRRKLGPRLARRLVAVVGHGYKFEA